MFFVFGVNPKNGFEHYNGLVTDIPFKGEIQKITSYYSHIQKMADKYVEDKKVKASVYWLDCYGNVISLEKGNMYGSRDTTIYKNSYSSKNLITKNIEINDQGDVFCKDKYLYDFLGYSEKKVRYGHNGSKIKEYTLTILNKQKQVVQKKYYENSSLVTIEEYTYDEFNRILTKSILNNYDEYPTLKKYSYLDDGSLKRIDDFQNGSLLKVYGILQVDEHGNPEKIVIYRYDGDQGMIPIGITYYEYEYYN